MARSEMDTDRPKVVIVLPTYNERENLCRILPCIHKVMLGTGLPFHVLVVDDDSPDGSADVVYDLQRKGCPVSLLGGARRGLGNAYARGFSFALNRWQPELIIQMDADFSHHPDDLPRLISAAEAGASVAIGSRYLSGLRISSWGIFRRMISRGGNWLSRRLPGMANIHDCTAGFRAWRAGTLAAVQLNSIEMSGYGFQVALLQRAVLSGAGVSEVEVDFPPRKHGDSKLRWFDLMEFGLWVFRQKVTPMFGKG